MKKSIFIFSSLLPALLLFNACQTQVETIDLESEKDAIIVVNEKERDAFFDKEMTRLEDVWVQEAGSKRILSSEKSLSIINGWSEIRANYQNDLEADRWEDYEDLWADFSNYEINVYTNSALVYHDILWTGKHLGEAFENESKRILHLVKKDGTWKISFIGQLKVPVKPQDIEEEITEEGQ
jgi:hypothetical protein